MTDVISVLIVDDSDDIRDLIRLALKRDERFDIIGEATDGQTGLKMVEEHRPSLLLVDLAMPVMDGLQVLDELSTHDDPPVAIVLSGFSSGPPEESAMEHGAAGYIEKGLALREMGDRIFELYTQARARA